MSILTHLHRHLSNYCYNLADLRLPKLHMSSVFAHSTLIQPHWPSHTLTHPQQLLSYHPPDSLHIFPSYPIDSQPSTIDLTLNIRHLTLNHSDHLAFQSDPGKPDRCQDPKLLFTPGPTTQSHDFSSPSYGVTLGSSDSLLHPRANLGVVNHEFDTRLKSL